MTAVKLSDLTIGVGAILDGFSVSPLHKKMLSMGLSPGQSISVLRKVPLGGSLYVKIDDRHVAFRYAEAQQISVKY